MYEIIDFVEIKIIKRYFKSFYVIKFEILDEIYKFWEGKYLFKLI